MKTQKGITLIALIITIIVMLILVTVSVTVALNTGMFQATQKAAKDTEEQRLEEVGVSNGTVNIAGEYKNVDSYVASLTAGNKEKQYKLVIGDSTYTGITETTTFADLIAQYDEFTETTNKFDETVVLYDGQYLGINKEDEEASRYYADYVYPTATLSKLLIYDLSLSDTDEISDFEGCQDGYVVEL